MEHALPESAGAKLRRALRENRLTVAPGAYDPLLARVIEHIGFPAVYAGGSAISSAAYGRPDMGLTTMTEMRDVVGNIAGAVSIPVLGDIEQGFRRSDQCAAHRARVRGRGARRGPPGG